jgi:predicted esterase
MSKWDIVIKISVVLGILVLFLLFRISTIDFHCAPSEPGVSYCRLSSESPRFIEGIAALFSESMQVQIGAKVALVIPNLITPDQSDRAADLAASVYAEMEQVPEWAFVHSSLGYTYESILHIAGEPNQYFVYIPPHDRGTKLPVVLFLHGYGGNFTSYLYLLSQAADNAQFAIVAPTYKQGIWNQEAIPFVEKVMTEAGNKFPIDTERITLMGISNGGLIMSNFIPAFSSQLRNVVFLSTYMELAQYITPSVLTVLQNVNTVKVIYGENDDRIEVSNMPTKVLKLRENGVNALDIQVPDEDHFLFFSQPDKVLNELVNLQY